jgi:transposase
MGRSAGISRRYTDYFVVEKRNGAGVNFAQDHEKIDLRLKRTGYFILLSTDLSLTSQAVLRIYRGRNVIEKNFDQLKNELDFRRLRTHLGRTTEGKVFVGFLALILRSRMLKKLKGDQETKSLTFEKVLRELRKIKLLTMPDNKKIIMPATKAQKKILAVLGVDLLHIPPPAD